MAEPPDRVTVAWRTQAQARDLARQARAVGLDIVAYLLEMAAAEASQYVVIKSH